MPSGHSGPTRRSTRTQTNVEITSRYTGSHTPAYIHDNSVMHARNWLSAHPDNFLNYHHTPFQPHPVGHVGSYQTPYHQYNHANSHGHNNHVSRGHQQQNHMQNHVGSTDHQVPDSSRSLRSGFGSQTRVVQGSPIKGGHGSQTRDRHGSPTRGGLVNRTSGGHISRTSAGHNSHGRGHDVNGISVGRSKKRGGHIAAPTSAGRGHSASGDAEETIESDDAEDIQTGTSSKSKNSHKKLEVVLTVDQMMYNCLFYMFLMQHKKNPIKRSDLIKAAMNSQHKQFNEVMKKLEQILKNVFGMILIRLGRDKDNQPYIITNPAEAAAMLEAEEAAALISAAKGKGKGNGETSTTYILVSKFPCSVFENSMCVMGRRDPEADSKKTALYLILSTIFMLNHPIDEEIIWKIIQQMGFGPMICEKREDLRKFLKSEYVLPCYLNMETIEDRNPNLAKRSKVTPTNSGTDKPVDLSEFTKAKYTWGPRSEKEYSKYFMLKFVTARFPGRKMYEFTVQYNTVQRHDKESFDKDKYETYEDNYDTDSVAGQNGSAIRIKKQPGGKGETFSIDGENTETETEVGD